MTLRDHLIQSALRRNWDAETGVDGRFSCGRLEGDRHNPYLQILRKSAVPTTRPFNCFQSMQDCSPPPCSVLCWLKRSQACRATRFVLAESWVLSSSIIARVNTPFCVSLTDLANGTWPPFPYISFVFFKKQKTKMQPPCASQADQPRCMRLLRGKGGLTKSLAFMPRK